LELLDWQNATQRTEFQLATVSKDVSGLAFEPVTKP